MAAPVNNTAPAGVNQSILLYSQDEEHDTLKDNINLANLEYVGQGSTSPAKLKDNWTDEGHNGILNCVGMIDESGTLHLLSALMALRLSIVGVQNHPDERRVVGVYGDTLNGMYFDYYLPDDAFKGISKTLNCLSGAQLSTDATAFVPGSAARFTSGPHQDSDAGVSPTNTRRLFKIPFFLIQHFMALPPDADVGLVFFRDMYPLIEAKNLVTACKSLIDYMRILVTLDAVGSTTSLVHLAAAEIPTPIGRNPDVLAYRKTVLQRAFPAIFVDQISLSQNQQFATMAHHQDAANKIASASLDFQKKQALKKKSEKIMKAVGGTAGASLLLRRLQLTSLEDLPTVMKELIEAEKGSARDAVLRRWANKIAEEMQCEAPPIKPGTADRILLEPWHMEEDTRPETGFLGNPLQWCMAKALAEAMQRQATLFDNANVKVTKEEVALLEKSLLYFCHINDFETLLNHGYVLWLTITGKNMTHPVVDFLSSYRTKVITNREKILSYPLREEKNRDITGILIQIRLAEELQKWIKAVERGDTPEPLNKNMIIDTVWRRGTEREWEAYSSTLATIEHRYADSLRAFRSLSGKQAGNSRQVGDTLRDELTVVGIQNDFSRVMGGAAGTAQTQGQREVWADDVSQIPDEISQQALAVPRPATKPRPAPGPKPRTAEPREQRGRGTIVYNRDGDRELEHVWQDLGKQCGPVKKAAKDGDHGVTPLPRSCVEGYTDKPICLNWNTLMWCRAECEEKHDHESQPAEKKAEIKQWVQEQAPKVPSRQRPRRGRGGNRSERE